MYNNTPYRYAYCFLVVIILKEKPIMIEESVALMDKLGSALLSTKVVGESEPSVFKTEELSMVLDRQTPSVLVRKNFQVTGGHGGISFPSRKALIKNFSFPLDSLDVQVRDQPCHFWFCSEPKPFKSINGLLKF